jgi:hypothetical protein
MLNTALSRERRFYIMSEFNSYAMRVNEVAQGAFKEYKDAEAAVNLANDKLRRYSQGGDAETQAKAARAKADAVEANEKLNEARERLEQGNKTVAGIRAELVKKLGEVYGADPSRVDIAGLELLKSGIVKPEECEALANKYLSQKNYTMVRLCGKYAAEAAEQLAEEAPTEREQIALLRRIAAGSQTFGGKQYIEAFDMLADVYRRCSTNVYMIDSWEQLTRRAIESF